MAILLAVRLAFRPIDDDDCRSLRSGCDGAPFEPDRKRCAAAPRKTGPNEHFDEGRSPLRHGAEPGDVIAESLWCKRRVRAREQPKRGHRGSRRSTADWKGDRASARGSREPVINR